MRVFVAVLAVLCGVIAAMMIPRRDTALRRRFAAEAARIAATPARSERITDADLDPLPPLVQRYLRAAGVVGQPRAHNVHVRFHGEIRSGPDSPWMQFTGEQYNAFDRPARAFIMDARRAGVPFQALHLYLGRAATMQVRVASAFTVVDARGPEMDVAETVTMFNDMCFFAPASLIGAPVTWSAIDARSVRATFSNAGHTIQAILTFGDDGRLADFVSDDRYRSSDGKTYARLRWSTPVTRFGRFGDVTLPAEGEGRWHAPSGAYAYIRFVIDVVDYNVAVIDTGDQPNRLASGSR